MSESASGEADSGSLSNTKKERFVCEGCGDMFVSYPSQTKGWCSRDCYIEHRDISGENNPNYSGGDVEITCENCGDSYEVNPAKEDSSTYCSRECKHDAQTAPGFYTAKERSGVYKDCGFCGEEIYVEPKRYEKYSSHYCGTQCRVEHNAEIHSGENHPNWNPNSTGEGFYQTEKWRKARLEALKRDKFTCQSCGEWDTKLHVHHIHPVSEGGERFDIDNLVTLCIPCHNQWEGLYLRPDTRHFS